MASAKAKAEAEWPEGNEVEVGMRTRRASGTYALSRSGRLRRLARLKTWLTVMEASPMAATPCRAERLPVEPPASAMTAAVPSHSLE